MAFTASFFTHNDDNLFLYICLMRMFSRILLGYDRIFFFSPSFVYALPMGISLPYLHFPVWMPLALSSLPRPVWLWKIYLRYLQASALPLKVEN